ncbi:BGTF surface domain-containing protein [Haloferax sp. S1W]|uniref:BGTF surface domain-containing protein n=1 Tax=Haloferax sp. S1W TaxID=3377110 RepID=UPI0037CC10A1
MHPLRQVTVVFVLLLLVTAGVAIATNETVIEHTGETLVLNATTDQHIRGTTPFEKGTVVGVRVKSIGETHPFLVSKTVRVGENGSFHVSFDLDELAPLRGGPIEVSIRHNSTRVHAKEGVLVTHNMPNGSTLTPPTTTAIDPSTQPPTETPTTTMSTPPTGLDIPGFGVLSALGAVFVLGLSRHLTHR